jgi:hypothetical protein
MIVQIQTFKLAFNAKAHWRRRIESRSEPAAFTRDEREAKRVCSSIARMIREFWQNVDKIVDFRANASSQFPSFLDIYGVNYF